MSIATEITRLQGIKTDIRTALVTQGIAQASSHNMADFSADILAIQGGSEGVYITVTCDSAYQGYDIILSANESELDRKQCPSSPSITEVTFFVSSDDVTLPATFTISNSLNDITTSFDASMYGWYNVDMIRAIVALIPKMTSNTTWSTLEEGQVGGVASAYNIYDNDYDAYKAFNNDSYGWVPGSAEYGKIYVQYKFVKQVKVLSIKMKGILSSTNLTNLKFTLLGSNTGEEYDFTLIKEIILVKLGTEYEFNIPKANYQYFRLVANSVSGGEIRNCHGYKIQLYGY